MFSFSSILSDLQAAIAAVAARERSLTVLLVAVWGRIARMRARLERLIAQWRAGTLPQPRGKQVRRAGVRAVRQHYPSGAAWLQKRVWGAGAFGTQLQHLLTDQECAAFLAAVPQAGRVLRPLFHMLGVSPVPEVVRKVRASAVVVVPRGDLVGLAGVGVLGGGAQFLEG